MNCIQMNTQENKGLFTQLKKGYIITYNRLGSIDRWSIALAIMYVFGSYFIKHSEPCKTEEDLYISLKHYIMVQSWNL